MVAVSPLRTSEETDKIDAALAAVQGELENPSKNKTAKVGQYSYKYVDFGDALAHIRPVMAKHKMSFVQATAIREGIGLIIVTRFMSGGQWIEGDYPVGSVTLNDGKAHQVLGGMVTYAKRYAFFAMIGVQGEEDLDGNIETPQQPAQQKSQDAKPRGPKPLTAAESQKIFDDALASLEKVEDRAGLRKWIEEWTEPAGRLHKTHADDLTAAFENVKEALKQAVSGDDQERRVRPMTTSELDDDPIPF